jgi:2-oxoglutarate ferredoxin oxidoreductase subunit delta
MTGEKQIEINREWCKGCGICVAFCPKQALILDTSDKAALKEIHECNLCGLCELRCPDMAIDAGHRLDDGE